MVDGLKLGAVKYFGELGGGEHNLWWFTGRGAQKLFWISYLKYAHLYYYTTVQLGGGGRKRFTCSREACKDFLHVRGEYEFFNHQQTFYPPSHNCWQLPNWIISPLLLPSCLYLISPLFSFFQFPLMLAVNHNLQMCCLNDNHPGKVHKPPLQSPFRQHITCFPQSNIFSCIGNQLTIQSELWSLVTIILLREQSLISFICDHLTSD